MWWKMIVESQGQIFFPYFQILSRKIWRNLWQSKFFTLLSNITIQREKNQERRDKTKELIQRKMWAMGILCATDERVFLCSLNFDEYQ